MEKQKFIRKLSKPKEITPITNNQSKTTTVHKVEYSPQLTSNIPQLQSTPPPPPTSTRIQNNQAQEGMVGVQVRDVLHSW